MNIGTPLSRSATRVMLLGAGEFGTDAETQREQLARRPQLARNALHRPPAMPITAALPASGSAVPGVPVGR
jgi:hypothetical protein